MGVDVKPHRIRTQIYDSDPHSHALYFHSGENDTMTHFPYLHQPRQQSWLAGARAEGRVHEMSWWHKLLYVWKYLFAQDRSAPSDIRDHFERQQQLCLPLEEISHLDQARLAFVGDIMWIRRNWGDFLGPEIKVYLSNFDGILGNLETVISKNQAVPELLPDYFTYNSDLRLIRLIHEQKQFCALSFANNHVLDKGDNAALDTLAALDQLGIPHSGLREEGSSWAEFTRANIRFGFHAATFGLNDHRLLTSSRLKLNWVPGLAPEREAAPDLSEIFASLREMEQKAVDVKIVYLHWGHEFDFYPTARQMQVARELVKAGADIILGSHPHVAQPSEVLFVNNPEAECSSFVNDGRQRQRKALVLYSLGNFLSYMATFHCRVAQVRGLTFFRRQDGFVDWQDLSTRLFYNEFFRGGVRLIPIEEVIKRNNNKAEMNFLRKILGQICLAPEENFR